MEGDCTWKEGGRRLHMERGWKGIAHEPSKVESPRVPGRAAGMGLSMGGEQQRSPACMYASMQFASAVVCLSIALSHRLS
eukprot:363411-Chlamydomonas_euryale.AAC.2